MVFGNKSGSGGMVKNVSTSVVGSEISFVYLRLIFLLCPTCRDQQLVRHIHNGLILAILSILADPFLKERQNQDMAAARPAVEKPARILMDLVLVGLVGHRDGKLVKMSMRLPRGARMHIPVLGSLVRTRMRHPFCHLGGKPRRILLPLLPTTLKIGNGLAWVVPALAPVPIVVVALADPKRVSTHSNSTNTSRATGGMIILNKSTIAEEDIEVPYGRGSTAVEDRERERAVDADADVDGAVGGGSGCTI